MKCQEQRNKTGQLFSNDVVSQSWADLFGRVGVCLSLSKYILIANMTDTASIEHHRQQFFQPTRCHQNILKTHNVPQVQGGFLSGHNFQNFDFWGAGNILIIFLRSVGCCLWLGLWPWLPRLDTAAHGSPQRPRFRGPAAPRGEGEPECEGQGRPWPRRRIWGGNLMKHGISLWGSEWRCWRFTDGSTFWWILFYLFVSFLAFTSSAPLLLQCTDKTCSIDGFSLAIFINILERPLQSKIDHKFPAPFNEPCHPDSIVWNV